MGHFQTGYSKNVERGSLFKVLHLFFIGIEFILESNLKMFMALCEFFTILFWKRMQFGEVINIWKCGLHDRFCPNVISEVVLQIFPNVGFRIDSVAMSSVR